MFGNRGEGTSGRLLAALRAALAAAQDKTVVFRGDGSVPYRTVVGVIDAARRAGATSLDMAHAPAAVARQGVVRSEQTGGDGS